VGAGGHLGGAADEKLFRDLIGGGPSLSRGVANIERVGSTLLGTRDWPTLLSRYALAPLADDTDGAPSEDAQVRSFDLPDAFAGLRNAAPARSPSATTYPLRSTPVDVGGARRQTFDFDLGASATAYFVLASPGPHGAVDVTLTTVAGAVVPRSVRPQIVVQRTR